MSLKRGLICFLATIIVTIVAFFLVRFLVELQGLEMSIHGEIALALGVFFTMALGVSLMALVFHSNKGGHDQHVHDTGIEKEDKDA